MRKYTSGIALSLACLMPAFGQEQLSIQPVRPQAPILTRPYKAASVPPVRLNNSGRLGELIKGGNLYLTAHDAVLLALENNIDIEVARYNPIMLEWRLERNEAGGTLPGVPSNSSQAASNTAGQGVLGSQQAAGIPAGNTGTVRNNTNATITQIGPVTPTLDPIFQEATTLSHRSLPQSNATGSATQVIVQNQRAYSGSLQQGLVTGGSVTVSYSDRYLNENAPTDVLNPSVAPGLTFTIQHNLLNGFGAAVGGRNITVAKMNVRTSDLAFRTQVSRTLSNVLNTYYTLAGDFEDVKSKQVALETSQTFLSQTRRRLELGSSAQLDVTTAQNQVAVATQGLVNSQLSLAQQEVQLKNLISRNGAGDPALMAAHIIPLDRISVPATDEIPPLPELIQKMQTMRTDLLSDQAGLKTAEVSAIRDQERNSAKRSGNAEPQHFGACRNSAYRARRVCGPQICGRNRDGARTGLCAKFSYRKRWYRRKILTGKPPGSGGLRDRSAFFAPAAAWRSSRGQSGSGGCHECGRCAASGASPLRSRGAKPDSGAKALRCGAEEVFGRRIDHLQRTGAIA